MNVDISIADVSRLPAGISAARQIVEEAAQRHRRAATAEFFLAQVGHDRPGLVHELAAQLSAFGANIEASTQTRLGRIGIMMVVVSVRSTSQQIELLRAVESGRIASSDSLRLSAMCLRSLGNHLDELWLQHGDPCRLRLESSGDKCAVSDFMLEVTRQLRDEHFAILDMVSYDDGANCVFDGLVLPPLSAGADVLEVLARRLSSGGNLARETGLSPYQEPKVSVDPSPYYLSVVGHARVGFVHDVLAALMLHGISFQHVRMSFLEGRSAVLFALPSPPERAAVDEAFDQLRERTATHAPWQTEAEIRHTVFQVNFPDEPTTDRTSWWSCTVEITAEETTGVIEQVTEVLLLALLNIDRMDTRVTYAADGRAYCKALYGLSREKPMSEAQLSGLERSLGDLEVVAEVSVLPARPALLRYVSKAATAVASLRVAAHVGSGSIRVDLELDPMPRAGSVIVDVAPEGTVALKFEIWSDESIILSRYVACDLATETSWSFSLDAPIADEERLLMISGGITVWAHDLSE